MDLVQTLDLTPTLQPVIYVIWGTVLLVVIAVIVPLAWILLHRTLRAAFSIRRYMGEMLTAGAGIAGNTKSVAALNDTIGIAGAMVKTAGHLKQHSGTIAEVLAKRAAKRS